MNDREQKIAALISGLTQNATGLELLRKSLYDAGFGLRSQVETTAFPTERDEERYVNAETGIILDCETTGFIPAEEGVTQLSMYKITFDANGILSLDEFFDRYNDPGKPISAEITALTGISNEMVAGQKIHDAEISDWMGDAKMIVAHNAEFDRKMLEHHFPKAGFDKIRWDCSMKQVDWKGRMFGGSGLQMLALNASDMVYDSHNAANDIRALAFVLNAAGPMGLPSGFVEMYERGTKGFIHIMAKDAPYAVKDTLKANGYQWAGDEEPVCGHSKVWNKRIPNTKEALAAEGEFLSSHKVFGRDKSLPAYRIGGLNAYSVRDAGEQITFHTAEAKTVMEALQLHSSEPPPEQYRMSL